MTLTRFHTAQEKEYDMEAEMQKGDAKRDVEKGMTSRRRSRFGRIRRRRGVLERLFLGVWRITQTTR